MCTAIVLDVLPTQQSDLLRRESNGCPHLEGFAALAVCLAVTSYAWAGAIQFHGSDFAGQGALNFTPGLGYALTISIGNGGNGALVTDFFNTYGICGGDCSIVGGYLTLATGGQMACPCGWLRRERCL